ncbi:molybdenum cofactor guanylyltransferase [Sulfitobacter sp. 15WGC]|uniref:molybdenum cofactor guanylyltransferase n=1 Tax=Sulfitobacter sp. 15WGC TaxID=2575437 RepID=UPI00145D0815|nr:molybdenum cofactor guanylyltransferase [Sulfitobacter sp. 15WGC]
MKQPLGVILAGGQATRMGGGDKGLLPLGQGTLLSSVIDRLEPQVAGLALNANGDAARFADLGLPVLADSIEGFAGPLAGVLAGLDWAAEQGAESIVTAAADTPFFPCDLVPRLLLAADGMAHPLASPPRRTRNAARRGIRPLASGPWRCATICAALWRAGCARWCSGRNATTGARHSSPMRRPSST